MPTSSSEATSTKFVNCSASEALAPGGKQVGFAITVGITPGSAAAEIFVRDLLSFGFWQRNDVVQASSAELWQGLVEWSNSALVPELPSQPIVSDGVATILAITLGNAAKLTCGELVALIGQRSPLYVAQLKRVSVDEVRGKQATGTRGDAQITGAEAAKEQDPFERFGDALGKLGIGVGVALAVVLIVVAALYFRKR